ncbi:MAG: signal peptidase I [Oscillospiraceae bacterium]|nr:signal peptidase I [Oscillospiraceae bacterium]
MRKSNELTAVVTALGILVTTQLIFLFLPHREVLLFVRLRPLLYLFALLIYTPLSGVNERPIPKASVSNIAAGYGAFFYLAALIIMGMIYGFGMNSALWGFRVVVYDLWVYAVTALLSEILRFNMIRNAKAEHRDKVAWLLVFIIYSFIQLDTLRAFMSDMNYANFTDFFFTAVFPAVILNAVLCYMAYEGALSSLLIIRGIYLLVPIISPFMPNMHKIAWAVITCALMLVTVSVYHAIMCGSQNNGGNSSRSRQREKIRESLREESNSAYTVSTVAIVIVMAFCLRAFAFFPVTILTGSMTGTIDKGSVAFVEKVKPEEVAATVVQGDIILFRQRNAEVMHRVIEIQYYTGGEPFYITKGDANAAADPYHVEQGEVLGITKAYIPYLGYPVVFLHRLI